MIKQIIKYGIYISCFVSFICFSYQSVLGFINGDVVYNVVVENDAAPGFPSVTLCPYRKKSLVNLKIEEMKSDLGLKDSEIEGYNMISPTIYFRNDISDLIEKYSFSANESLIPNSNGSTIL